MGIASRAFLRELQSRLDRDIPTALCTIFRKRGSSPAPVGARMAVSPGFPSIGTIGGSEMELQVESRARELVRSAGAETLSFDLQYRKLGGIDVSCGGAVDLLIETLTSRARELVRTWADLRDRRQAVRVVHRIRSACGLSPGLVSVSVADGSAAAGLVDEPVPHDHDGKPCVAPVEEFRDLLAPGPYVLLVGGGHINAALAPILDALDYDYAILDDRPEFASEARFPHARERFAAPPGEFLARDISGFTHVVVCTWSQEIDFASAKSVLSSGAPVWIGVIGSRSKRRDFERRLAEAGISEEKIRSMEMPVGMEIGAVTVPEIAISIASSLGRSFRSR